ncbi:MAG: DUF1028 domain-containing protein [Magnetovibrio sp.]|nr:DUF1028 domain-containing protein [Magnetovibrio sp.]
MTFAVLGRCEVRGQAGVAIATSSIAIGARCPFVLSGVGAASTQNVTDPRLGPALLELMAEGASPREAIDMLTAGRPDIEHRQLAAVDLEGRTAHYTGAAALGISAGAEGAGCVAVGNLLANEAVPAAMAAGFEADDGAYLADHLMAGLRAGLEAGGEAGDVHSAALLIAGTESWPVIDLRVDWSDADPIGELAALWRAFEPQMDDYVTRALNPSAAPSYGVPGDE